MASSSGAAIPQEIINDDLPKVLFCGAHRSGKTSILKVVFLKMSPHETLFLETTPKVDVTQVTRNAGIRFKVLDFPGSVTFDEPDAMLFSKANSVVYVINAQEEPYTEAITNAARLIELASRINRRISFDILIHKVDGDQFYLDDQKQDISRHIKGKLMEQLHEMEMHCTFDANLEFHCTSIYDHTIFVALSKVVQKLIPELPYLEQSLDLLITNSRMEKAFLFDVVSKIYIASDRNPVDAQSYELCSDMIDVVIDVSCIYGLEEGGQTIASSIACDAKASCTICLNNDTLLYLRELDRCLALVCILREENFDRQHLVDYNIHVFKEALTEIFRVPRSRAVSAAA